MLADISGTHAERPQFLIAPAIPCPSIHHNIAGVPGQPAEIFLIRRRTL